MKNESLIKTLMPKVIEIVQEVGDFIITERRNFDMSRGEVATQFSLLRRQNCRKDTNR